MNYKYIFIWLTCFSYLYSLLDLIIMWYSKTVKPAFTISFQYNFIIYYYIVSFILYFFICLTIPFVTGKKRDLLFSFGMLFYLHLTEDFFYWLNGFLVGIYKLQDLWNWNPNLLLPQAYQWLNLTLPVIYIFDLACIIYFFSIWFYVFKKPHNKFIYEPTIQTYYAHKNNRKV